MRTAWPTAPSTRRPRGWSESAAERRRPPDVADHAARPRPLAPVGMVEVGAAIRAVGHIVDPSVRQARGAQLRPIGRPHVEVRPAPRPGPEERAAVRTEFGDELRPDLVAAGTDARPERG